MTTRRDFLKLPVVAAAAAAAIPTAHAVTPYSMPGLYPGRVVGIVHSGASVKLAYQSLPIQGMIRRGMAELTGLPNYIAAWRKLFQPDDVVGIKVNGVSQSAALIPSPACLEIVNGLLLAGVPAANIVVFERYGEDLSKVISGGWLPSGIRTACASPGGYLSDQTGIDGYDPDHYVDLPEYLLPWQKRDVAAHTRSHVSLAASRQVTKIISLAVLKDHQAAGVTLNLKNLAIGCFNNCNRFHDNGLRDDRKNYLVNAIPALISSPVLRSKVVLGIIDGTHCLVNGGPAKFSDPKYGFVVAHNTMYFATDIVAADRIGWLALNAERARKGLPAEEVAGPDQYDAFSRRQPQHITAAGQLGLGEWRDDRLDFRKVVLA